MEYRELTKEEIRALQNNQCRAVDWERVKVSGAGNAGLEAPVSDMGFEAKGVRFEGDVYIGGGCTITDSTIVDCTIGPCTEIHNVERLENYVIGKNCRIYNSGRITAKEYAAMGCGTAVNVLDETGSRQVPICPELTAQTAYIMAFYRHDMALVNSLASLVRAWGEEHATRQGSIGDGAVICYVTAIVDVNIGPRSQIRSAVKLENGTLGAETLVLENVSASDFILSDKAVLGETCVAKQVFLGQAARLGNGFVAHNSLIFANSILECGETDALFAGPHTVSYHRSTLLIAAATSFFNAGSGTNQSNHYYCTGPIHHGIMERGCKTGSDTYIKWPARFGQFSVIIGSHGNHPDTSALPFSYVFGNNGATTVIPAASLKTCGVMRDVLKWRGRDARSNDLPRLDCINYEEFTPYNAEKMFQGIDLLERLRDGRITSGELRFEVSPTHIDEGIRLYKIGLKYFFGKVLVDHILPNEDGGLRDVMDGTPSMAKWVDMAGMIAPRSVIDGLCSGLKNGEFDTLSEVNEEIAEINEQYMNFRWLYVLEGDRLQRVFGLKSLAVTDLKEIVRQWKEAAEDLRRLREADAMKDFAPEMQVGFGIDHPEFAQSDIVNSVGLSEENVHVKNIREHYALDAELADVALAWLDRVN